MNVSVTMMSRRAGVLAWTPGDAFAGKKVEVVFAPERSRRVTIHPLSFINNSDMQHAIVFGCL